MYPLGAEVTVDAADLTPPTITIDSPAEGASFLLGEVVTPSYRCHDDVDGACVGSKATPIDTATVGTHTSASASRR